MRFNLLPDASGYKVSMTVASTISTELEGGMPAKRLDVLDAVYIVDVQFTLPPYKYNYFREFIEAYNLAPDWFDILLVTEPYVPTYPLINHKAQIIPGSLKFSSFKGFQTVVAMQLEAYPSDLIGTAGFGMGSGGGGGSGNGGGGGSGPIDPPEADELGELLLNGMMIPQPLLSWNGNNLNVATNGSYPAIEWIMPAHPGYVPGGHYVIRGKCPDAGAVQLNIKIKKPGLPFDEWPDIGILTFLNYTKPYSTRTFHIPADWNETDPIYISTNIPYGASPYTLLSIKAYTPDPEQLLDVDSNLIDQQQTYYSVNGAAVYWDGMKLVVDPQTSALPSIYFGQEFTTPRVLAPGRLFHFEGTSEVTGATEITITIDWVIFSTVQGYDATSTAIVTSADSGNWSGDIRIPENWLGHNYGTNIRISFSVSGAHKKVTLTSMKLVDNPDELLNGSLFVDDVSLNPSWDGAKFTGYSPYGSGSPFTIFEFAASPPAAFVAGGQYNIKFWLTTSYSNLFTFEIGYISSGTPVFDGGGFVVGGVDSTVEEEMITIPASWNGTDILIFRITTEEEIVASASFSIFSIKAVV